MEISSRPERLSLEPGLLQPLSGQVPLPPLPELVRVPADRRWRERRPQREPVREGHLPRVQFRLLALEVRVLEVPLRFSLAARLLRVESSLHPRQAQRPSPQASVPSGQVKVVL